jgi:hypothetical protein
MSLTNTLPLGGSAIRQRRIQPGRVKLPQPTAALKIKPELQREQYVLLLRALPSHFVSDPPRGRVLAIEEVRCD